jgi:ABC-type branched-subunit amino acid transport system ATPase component
MASTAYILRHGEIAFSGSAEELRNQDVFAEYLGTGSH